MESTFLAVEIGFFGAKILCPGSGTEFKGLVMLLASVHRGGSADSLLFLHHLSKFISILSICTSFLPCNFCPAL